MTYEGQHLFERWTSVRSLWAASLRAARGKRHRQSVARTLFDLEPTVLALEDELRSGAWIPGASTTRTVRDPKPRLIHINPFRDRIVHQALCHAIGPRLERGLIADTYACRKGLGTHAALRRATAWARSYPFFVHLDVRKLFPTIDHALLLEQLERDVRCERTLAVVRLILKAGTRGLEHVRFHFAGDDLFSPLERQVGLPIGSLTSQHFANRFLSPLDHRARDRLRIRPYLRYMDDMLVFGHQQAEVAAHALDLEERAARLRLRLHPWQVRPTRAGVSFLGFRILPHELRVRRSSVARAERRLAEQLREGDSDAFTQSLRAVFAHWAHGDTHRLRTRLLRRLGLLAGDDDTFVILHDANSVNRDTP